MNSLLLARQAESVTWLARYLERIENLARILEVTHSFDQDARPGQNWQSVVQINADVEAFTARHGWESAHLVPAFYLLETDNPTSLPAALAMARENARVLRALLPAELWQRLTALHQRVADIVPEDLVDDRLPRLCADLRGHCLGLTGVAEGSMQRDQLWYFFKIGKFLERADQMTRMLDIKYHLLLPRADSVGSPQDLSQWATLLRATDGYHAFRRVWQRPITPQAVTGFLLLNDSFPRSVLISVRGMDQALNQLRMKFHLRGGNRALEKLDSLHGILTARAVEEIIFLGLHEFLDRLQGELNEINDLVARDFFG